MKMMKNMMIGMAMTTLLVGCGSSGGSSDSTPTGKTGQAKDDSSGDPQDPVETSLFEKVPGISAGSYTSVILDDKGDAYSFGQGAKGELGHGDTKSRYIPTKVEAFDDVDIIQVFASRFNTLYIDDKGDVYASGQGFAYSSDWSEYGDHLQAFGDLPVKLEGVSNIVQVSASEWTALFLDSDGDVYGVGMNAFGMLGTKDIRLSTLEPKKIEGLKDITAISAGDFFTLALDKDGDVYSLGNGSWGQLGNGEAGYGHYDESAKRIESLSNIVAISAGDDFSLVLDRDGYVYSFGHGHQGQLGDGQVPEDTDSYLSYYTVSIPQMLSLSDIIGISAGESHSLVLGKDGKVYSFGYGADQLGYDHRDTGSQSRLLPEIVEHLSDIIAISAGGSHSLVMDKDGHVYSFGSAGHGVLGHGDHESIALPTKIEGVDLIE